MRCPFVGAGAAISSATAIAVVAENSDILREAALDDPAVDACSHELLSSVNSAVVVDMIYRQELALHLAAARTCSALVIEDLAEPFGSVTLGS